VGAASSAPTYRLLIILRKPINAMTRPSLSIPTIF
jgi:hypothetical protein